MEKEKSYIIKLEDGTQVQVSKRVYQCYYRQQWREEKYEAVWRKRSYSLDEVMEKGAGGKYGFSNLEKPLEDEVIRAIEISRMRQVFNSLNQGEKELLKRLILEEEIEEAYAEVLGITRAALNYRKFKLLRQLKEKMKC